MAEIRPFKAVRYNPDIAGDVSMHICPPFDVITPQLQQELYERSEYNIVRLELTRRGLTDDPYEQAATTRQEWTESGVLKQDEAYSIYVTEEEFEYQGQKMFRRGFVSAVRLEDYDQEVILPHEGTRSEWVADRVKLMGAAQSNYSPLLVIYRDDLRSSVGNIIRAIAGGPPTVVFNPPDMPQLRMWRVSDPGTIEVIQNALKDAQVFIADGHHRYEAALRYRSSVRSEREVDADESINFRMMLMVSFDEPGLITRGYHRLIESPTHDELEDLKSLLRSSCELTEWIPTSGSDLRSHVDQLSVALGERDSDEVVFGLYGLEPGKFHVARMRDLPDVENALDNSEYSRLHTHLLEKAISEDRVEAVISPHHESGLIARQLENGEAELALIMRPVPLDEFVSIVTRGWRLPAKATNFFPKPPAGAVIQQFQDLL